MQYMCRCTKPAGSFLCCCTLAHANSWPQMHSCTLYLVGLSLHFPCNSRPGEALSDAQGSSSYLRPWAQLGGPGAPCRESLAEIGTAVHEGNMAAWPPGGDVKIPAPSRRRTRSPEKKLTSPCLVAREMQTRIQPKSVSLPGRHCPPPTGCPAPPENAAKDSLSPWCDGAEAWRGHCCTPRQNLQGRL